jgi:peroxiredoxin
MKWRSLEESIAGSDPRSLREQFAERKELIAKYVPAETQAVHARVITELHESGIVGRALAVGTRIPDFELHDHNHKVVRSADLLSQGVLVICFIRGRWCPFCVGQMEAMNAVLRRIRQLSASLVAISPQTEKQAFFMVDQHKLQFPVLVDAANRVARHFGIVYRVPENQEAIYRRAFINLPFANGDDSWELPIPSTFIVDRNAIIQYASVNADYTERPEPAEIIDRLSQLR